MTILRNDNTLLIRAIRKYKFGLNLRWLDPSDPQCKDWVEPVKEDSKKFLDLACGSV